MNYRISSIWFVGVHPHIFYLIGFFSAWVVIQAGSEIAKNPWVFFTFFQKKSQQGPVASGPPPKEDLTADLNYHSIFYLPGKMQNTANTSIPVPWGIRGGTGSNLELDIKLI